jgi:hypothetical protein
MVSEPERGKELLLFGEARERRERRADAEEER